MDILGVAPWVLITGIVTWVGQAMMHHQQWKKFQLEHAARIDEHRSDVEQERESLMVQLLSSARQEVTSARVEMESLREEIKTLRALEQHFYHFQQSMEHLEAIVTARGPEDRKVAERNASAFLTRMRRLADAKGTIANEAQRVDSKVEAVDRAVRNVEDGAT